MLLCANLLNIMVAFLYNDNDEYKHEDHVSKVRVFLKKANHFKDVYSLRPNYLQTIAILLDGMGNVQLCCFFYC